MLRTFTNVKHYAIPSLKAEEVPELQGGLRQTQTSNFGDLITVGDLALAKVPLNTQKLILRH